jgi:hypothetical protein
MRRVVAMVWLLSLLTSCALTGDRTSSPPGPTPGLSTNSSPAEPPGTSSAPSVPVPSLTSTTDTQTPGLSRQQAIRLAGRTQVWNGDTQAYETVAQFTRDAQLFLVTKEIGGGTAFAILSGQLFEEKAGAILFATNTAALRDIPDISRNLVTASIDVAGLDVDDPGSGKFHATVDPVMARAVTVLYFHIRNGAKYPSKQILTGTVSLELTGEEVSGEIGLEGADFVGGARPLNRYLATMTSR